MQDQIPITLNLWRDKKLNLWIESLKTKSWIEKQVARLIGYIFWRLLFCLLLKLGIQDTYSFLFLKYFDGHLVKTFALVPQDFWAYDTLAGVYFGPSWVFLFFGLAYCKAAVKNMRYISHNPPVLVWRPTGTASNPLSATVRIKLFKYSVALVASAEFFRSIWRRLRKERSFIWLF